MIVGEAYVEVRPDLNNFQGETEKGVLGSVSGIAKKAAAIMAGAFIVKQGVDVLSGFVDQARESNKIAAQTAQVILSTGSAAGITAAQVSDLSTAISNKVGIDDEAIQSGANLLLTFTNIRNEVGAGNDIFNQATQTITDMSSALGQDMKASSIQLGKALNDPITGMTALRRVGVSFTEQQQDQVKAMVASGNLLGAQKLILGELSKEFGGSAAAQATAADRLSVTWGNLQEELGNYLIPVLDAVSGWLADQLPGAIDFTIDAVKSLIDFAAPGFRFLADTVSDVASTVGEAFGYFQSAFDEGDTFGFSTDDGWIGWVLTLGAAVRGIWDDLQAFWYTLTTGFTADEGTPVEGFALMLRDTFLPIVQAVIDFMRDHWQPVLAGAAIALALFFAPVTTLIAGFTLLYLKNEGFRNGVNQVRAAITAAIPVIVSIAQRIGEVATKIGAVLVPILRYVGTEVADFVRFFSERFDKIRTAVENVLKAIAIAFAIMLAPALLAWSYFHEQIMAVVMYVWDQVRNVIQTTIRIIGDVLDVIISLLSGDWAGAWNAAKDIPAAFVDFIKTTLANLLTFAIDFFTTLPANLLSALGDFSTELVPKGVELLEGVLNGMMDKGLEVAGWLIHLPLDLIAALPSALTALYGLGSDLLHGAWDGAMHVFGLMVDWFKGLPSRIKDAIGDLGSLLLGAGFDLAKGFLDGIKNAFIGGVDYKHIKGPNGEDVIVVPGQPGYDTGVLPPEFGGGGRPASGGAAQAGKSAAGRVVDHPMLSWLGEGFRREVVLPLTDARRTWELAMQSGLLPVLQQGAAMSGARPALPGGSSGLAGDPLVHELLRQLIAVVASGKVIEARIVDSAASPLQEADNLQTVASRPSR